MTEDRGTTRRVLGCLLLGLVLGGVLLPGGPLLAQSTFSVDSASATTGSTVTLEVRLDHLGAGLSGWSLGVCSDPTDLVLDSVTDGPALLTARNGAPPDFHLLTMLPGGFTSGVVVCFVGCALLPAGTDLLLYEPSYTVVGLAPTFAEVAVCPTLGDPPVAVVVLDPIGDPSTPATVPGGVDIPGPLPLRYALSIANGEALYDPDDGIASPEVGVALVEEPDSAGAPNSVTGFTIPVRHDPLYLSGMGAVPGPDLVALGGGTGPETFLVDVTPDGIVVSATIAPGTPWMATIPQEAVTLLYETVPSSLAFNFFGVTTGLAVDASVTTPVTAPLVTATVALPLGLTAAEGSIHLVPRQSFRRGDANDDGTVDIADVLAALNYLFTGGSLSCLAASDANGDAMLDIGDTISLLNYLFTSGAPPAAPFPDCGFDPTTSLGCSFHGACPAD